MGTVASLPTKEDFEKLYTVAGTYCYRAMFIELSLTKNRKKHPPVFTLKPREHKGLPSAYEVYITSVDEYDAAQKLVPNMTIWENLCSNSWFMDGDPTHNFEGLAVWRERMKARDASDAKRVLQTRMEEGDVTAAKAVLAETKTKASAGRKTNKKKPVQTPTDKRILEFRKKA